MRFVVVVVVGLSACATPKTLVEVPSCADRVEVQGQAERLSSRRFELDHTFDFVGTKTELSFEREGGGVERFEVWNSQPDPVRLLVSTGITVVGGLLIASAIYDVRVLNRDLFDERPFYESLWGGGMIAVGALGITTGWHPDRKVIRFEGACGEPEGVSFER
jgi:hypothetical protein